MTGSKDVCGSCSAPFYGRQQFLACSGTCRRRFHCKCINVVEGDYDLLMVNGVSSYKCSTCVKRLDSQETKVGDAHSSISMEETGSHANHESSVTEVSLHMLVAQLCNKIDALAKDVKMLKADNEALRLRLSENTELLRKASTPLEVQGLPARQSSNFAAALKNPSKSTTNTDDDGIGRQSTKPFRLPQRSNLATATQPEPKRNDVDAEGFQTFTRKKRVKPTEGRNTVSKLSCVPRQPRRRALFISRLNPHTTESDITESLAGVLKGKWMKCTKLATKHDSYASFHVLVENDDFDEINTPDIWPAGCLFRPFFGILKELSDTDTSVDVNA